MLSHKIKEQSKNKQQKCLEILTGFSCESKNLPQLLIE
jgi:hypothetical protein